jgi:hypothetical protein
MDANQSSSKQAIDISEAVWDQNLLEYGSSVESAKDDRLTTDQDELAREIDGRSHAQSEAEASQLSSGTPSSPDHAHTVGCLSPDMPDHESEENSQNIAGVAMGARETGQLYADQVRFGASRGHGFAAEQGNHLWDKLHGYDAKIVGDDNLLNGPDRCVDGIYIQSKYCAKAGTSIGRCFDDETGLFRYWNKDGTPMQIEVPSDQYPEAVQSMRDRIKNGTVPGVTDPDQAENIVRKGNLTYEQAVNIAKSGTIESLTFDAINGVYVGAVSGSVSAAISFAQSIWNGEEIAVAARASAYTFLRVGGTSLATSIIVSQVGRTAFERAFRGASEKIVESLSNKSIHALVKSLSGKALYGAAATKTLQKLLRGNIATMVVTNVVLSLGDIYHICNGRISGAQLTKNVTNLVVGTTGGWLGTAIAGAAAGSLFPGIGTVGGFIVGATGGLVGGSAASGISSSAMNYVITDDSVANQIIFEQQLVAVATDFLLMKEELGAIVEGYVKAGFGKFLKEIHAQGNNGPQFAYDSFAKKAVIAISKRTAVKLPSSQEMFDVEATLLGEMIAECANAGGVQGDDPNETATQTRESLEPFQAFFLRMLIERSWSSCFFAGPNLETITGRKRLGCAMEAYGRAGGVPLARVLAVIDTTVWRTAKYGILMTDEAMWFKSPFDAPTKVDLRTYAELARIRKECLCITSPYINNYALIGELEKDMIYLQRALRKYFGLNPFGN